MPTKTIIFIALFCLASCSNGTTQNYKNKKVDVMDEAAKADLVYKVYPLKDSIRIDADWDKPQWKSINALRIENQMGDDPKFRPLTEAKMMYDDENIYVIFRVKDRYVRSVIQAYNGNVSGDACVEFFFSPDANFPMRYFNLEVNCGGTPLIFYITKPGQEMQKLKPHDIDKIEIAHSMAEVVDPEITEPVTWTLEYRVPLALLNQFSDVSRPRPGVIWRANFYKTANKCSNPHYLTWSFVNYPKPNFHLPEYFGTLLFQ